LILSKKYGNIQIRKEEINNENIIIIVYGYSRSKFANDYGFGAI
jgi:hypothetical protein